ncbi:MAG: hypothetical protein VX733_09350 [Candidatus Latescibacterota bacterium]|nr:hypothetical protein [Candidatus Latescibacterota bacterium]
MILAASARYRAAWQRGLDWILPRIADDGTPGPALQRLFYYRLPWTLALTGEIEAANRVLSWIVEHTLSDEGELDRYSPRGRLDELYGSYPLACFLMGAVLLQRFDVIRRSQNRLLGWQDSQTGGFWECWQQRGSDSEQLLFPTAQGGMTLLALGRISAALCAGEWLEELWRLQPYPEEQLYAARTHRGLVVNMDGLQEVERIRYLTLRNRPFEHHFNGGIAAAFLAQLYQATGDERWRQLAEHYQRFSMETDDCQFESMQTCKSGWGSGCLYAATGESKYRDWTLRMGEWFVAHQAKDGHWSNTPRWNPEPDEADDMEITAEFVMHLVHICRQLASR